LPCTHDFEQQSPSSLQELPDVEHVAFRATHVPFAQLPPQHWLLFVHLRPSEMQALAAHFLFSQRRSQQSVAAAHAWFGAAQVVTTDAHVLLFVSQRPEQQSVPPLQASLNALHEAGAPPEPPELTPPLEVPPELAPPLELPPELAPPLELPPVPLPLVPPPPLEFAPVPLPLVPSPPLELPPPLVASPPTPLPLVPSPPLPLVPSPVASGPPSGFPKPAAPAAGAALKGVLLPEPHATAKQVAADMTRHRFRIFDIGTPDSNAKMCGRPRSIFLNHQ